MLTRRAAPPSHANPATSAAPRESSSSWRSGSANGSRSADLLLLALLQRTPVRKCSPDLDCQHEPHLPDGAILLGEGRRRHGNVGSVDEEVVPVLYVEDAGRAVAWYERLGFQKEWEHQFEPGFPLFVSVARGRVRLYLSEHKGDARPNTLIHLYVADIDRVSEEFDVPVDEEGLAGRECQLEDPDGNRLRVATRRT